jgi:hypothetical protein
MQPVKRLDGESSFHLLDFKISDTKVQDQVAVAETSDSGGAYIEDPGDVDTLLDVVGTVMGASSYNPHGGGAGTLTYSATQGATEGLVRVCVTPDTIYSALMSGTLAAGGALQTITNTAASTDGLTITATDTPDNDMDDGTCWCLSGANVGQSRRVTTYTANTSLVVTVPFINDIAVGDTFAVVPYSPPIIGAALSMTTGFRQANAAIAYGTGGVVRMTALVLNGVSDSYLHFVFGDHVYNPLS